MPRAKGIRPVIVCEACGKTFTVANAFQARSRIYCGDACSRKARITTVEVRFREYIGPTTNTGCILWIGCVNEHGYGIINAKTQRGKNILAHRLAWEMAHGHLSDDFDVLHSCDNPPCINVDHLFLGTPAINAADKVSKGRHPQGEASHFAKLSEADVLEIRERYANGGVLQRELAKEFGTMQSMVSRIVHRTIWKHI